jgi:hypothetical protein
MGDDGAEEPGAIETALALAATLPGAAVARLFARYGKPLAAAAPPAGEDAACIEVALGAGVTATVRAINVRTMVDVIGNDWFVFEAPGAEPLAMPGPLFAAAVAALTRKAGAGE